METKELTITDEASERLNAYKLQDESFTAAILRLTGNEADVLDGFGVMSDAEAILEDAAVVLDRVESILDES